METFEGPVLQLIYTSNYLRSIPAEMFAVDAEKLQVVHLFCPSERRGVGVASNAHALGCGKACSRVQTRKLSLQL